jgi:hypothetical protein
MKWILLLMLFSVAPSAVDEVAETGRVVGLVESPSERLNPPAWVAPGAPPLLRFRYFDASDRGRFGDLGLMMDDAGH